MIASSLFFLLFIATIIPGIVTDNQCDCYFTNESSANYFTTHKFFDFRSLSEYAGVPRPITDACSQALATSDYFLADDWNEHWGIQQWNNSDSVDSGDAPLLNINSPNNVYIETNDDDEASSDTYLTMRTLRLTDFQSSAEFESISRTYHFLSVRMYARTIGSPGAVFETDRTAMFTYKDNGDPSQLTHVQESDLEILTKDPEDSIQYTNQPSYSSKGDDVPESTRNVTTSSSTNWTEWAVHRMDWDPSATTWFIDGKQVASIAFQVPRDPSQVIFNSWSDGGEWSGEMDDQTSAYLQIQWIDMVYNSTEYSGDTKRSTYFGSSLWGKRDGKTCDKVCSIDETTTTGTPVMLTGRASRVYGDSGAVHFWIPLLLSFVLLCLT
ncbi:glycoside hydrolase family 16 protein [Xylariaceae sp. FL1019]|nr:glycoside hydrolase family 16 protein [Xylariaceae sp. FL1019]